jgi:hypothetical protein
MRGIVGGKAFGRDVIERGIASAIGRGYLQPRSEDGTWGKAVDELVLPPAGASGNAGRIVQRSWFDGSLSVKEMAAILFLRAGTGKGSGVFARELAERFDWSRPTVNKVINALVLCRTFLVPAAGRKYGGSVWNSCAKSAQEFTRLAT